MKEALRRLLGIRSPSRELHAWGWAQTGHDAAAIEAGHAAVKAALGSMTSDDEMA